MASNWGSIFKILALVGTVLALCSFVGNWIYSWQTDKSADTRTFRRNLLLKGLTLTGMILALVSFVGGWISAAIADRSKNAKISALERKIEEQRNTIVSATAVVEMNLIWEGYGGNSHETGTRGYVAFGKNDEQATLVIRSEFIKISEDGKDRAKLMMTANLTTPESEVNGSLNALRSSELVRIRIPDAPDSVRVVDGELGVVLNGTLKFKFVIPPQQVSVERVFVRDLGNLSM